MRAVLLAGGMGVRLRPLTYTIPKPLLPVGERPILEEIIERLKAFDIDEYIITVGYRAELIETYFRNGAQLGVKIDYVHETQPLGTAGALSLVRGMRDLPDDEPLYVMNGDILTDLDVHALMDAHRRGGHDMTIATVEFELQHPYGVLRVTDGEVTGIMEKPTVTDTVSTGMYAIQPSALSLIPEEKYFDMPDLVNALLAERRSVGAWPFHGEWLAIQRMEQLDEASRMLAERRA
ncbi:MAG: sugar phosphate nucleotidyltransferase [Dehalococcoidia bacterium]